MAAVLRDWRYGTWGVVCTQGVKFSDVRACGDALLWVKIVVCVLYVIKNTKRILCVRPLLAEDGCRRHLPFYR